LRIVLYNIQEHGRGRLDAIADVVRAARPDAVALVEADEASMYALSRALGMEARLGQSSAVPFHVAWLTRLPIVRAENHRLPALAKTLLELEVRGEAGPMRLFATHLASSHEAPTYTPRREVEAIVAALRATPGPHLLVGDLNALGAEDPIGRPPLGVEPKGEAVEGTPREVVRRLVEAGYVDCYRRLHPRRPGFTYPADSPWLRLDYAFVSRDLASRLRGCEVLTSARVSDHLPLVVELG
jgi:exodeoxyribonuclease-3